MPTNYYTGKAPLVAQVDSITPTAANNAVYILTNGNGNTVTYTADASATVAEITAGLVAAVQASNDAEWKDVVASDETTYVKLTASNPGVPFTVTSSTTGGGALVRAAVTASSGPSHWEIATNWSRGNIPQGTLAAPVQAAASASSGGSLTDTQTYYWVVTATNANGETVASNERSLTIAAPNQTANLSWAQVAGATGYKVYRSTSSGTYGATSLAATISSGSTLVYVDAGGALSAGTPPGVSTAVGDDIVIANTSNHLRYDLDQSDITPASLTLFASFTGDLGLPWTNAQGYGEYRTRYLTFAGLPTATIGKGDGQGSTLVRLDCGSGVASTVYVPRTSSSSETGLYALCLLASNASVSLYPYRGSIGVAPEPGQTSTLTLIDTGYESSAPADVSLHLGSGVTLSGCTLNMQGGQVDVNSNLSAVNMRDGLLTTRGTATVGTARIYGGRWENLSSGTATTTYVYDGGVVDNGRDLRARTYTNVILYKGATWLDPFKTVTATNGYVVPDGLNSVTHDFGKNVTLTVA